MFASFTTAVHFCVSAAMKVENSSGEPSLGRALSLARTVSISLVFIITLISALSLLTMDTEVPAGARMPDQYELAILGTRSLSLSARLGAADCGPRQPLQEPSVFPLRYVEAMNRRFRST